MILSRTYIKKTHPYAYATFTDFERGKGLVQFHSDWGIFHSYWDAIGDRTIEEFVLSCNNQYLHTNLKYWVNFMMAKKGADILIDKFLLFCWPDLKEIIKEESKVKI